MADNLEKALVPVWHSGKYPPKAVHIFVGGLQRVPAGNQCMTVVGVEAVAEELARVLRPHL